VPWKQGRGYASAALAALLPVARDVGLAVVTISCDSDNAASQKVVLANGGVLAQVLPDAEKNSVKKLVFRIEL
jgi:predicted acetyltransferase